MPPIRKGPKSSSKVRPRSPSPGSSRSTGQSSHGEEPESDGDRKTQLQINALAAQLKHSSNSRREAKRKAQERVFAKKATKLAEKIEGTFEKLREAQSKSRQATFDTLIDLVNARTRVERKIAVKMMELARMQENARAELREAFQAKLDELDAPAKRAVGHANTAPAALG